MKKVAVVCGVILVIVAIYSIWKDPDRDVVDQDVPFEEVFDGAILSADVYELSEKELASKFDEQEVYVRDLPDSQIRYFLLIDHGNRTQRIAVRGTNNLKNFVVDIEYIKQVDPTLAIYLHRGFRNAAAELLEDIQTLPTKNDSPTALRKDYKTIITGHSLGGAVAAILLLHLRQAGYLIDHTVTFGQPKVTNVDGAKKYAESKLLRIINLNDFVTRVPPRSLLANRQQPYQHFAPEVVMLKDNSYVYQLPVMHSDAEVDEAVEKLNQVQTRGLWDDYLIAHRMVNYIARLQEVMKSGSRLDASKITDSGPLPEGADSRLEPRKLALLVGINDYQADGVPDLLGCVNDVHSMKALLVGQFGFSPENVRILTNTAATHKRILREIDQSLIWRADKGDTVVFHFSGHGSQMKDVSGDETDQWDETIVPYDSRTSGVFDIADDDLNHRFGDLAEKTNLTVILDCCHSGSGVRELAARQIPRDPRDPPATLPGVDNRSPPTAASAFRENLDCTIIAAAREDELANELNVQGDSYGALTHNFVQEAKRPTDTPTSRDVMDRVMLAVNRAFPNQHPQVEGSEIDNRLFGATEIPVSPYITVSLRSDGSPVLLAGTAQGMTKGSILDVYSPSTKDFESATPIARVELTEVRPFTSEAKIVSGDSIPYAARAIERSHVYAGFKFYVFAPGQSDLESQLRESLSKHEHVTFVDFASEAQVEVNRQDGKLVVSAPQQRMSKSFDDSVQSVELAERLILHWSKWFNLLLLDNPESALTVQLQVGDEPGVDTFVAGDHVPVTVRNTSGHDIYYSMLDLESTGDVSILWPPAGQNAKLPSGGEWTRQFRFTVPGQSEIRDFIKVIATVEPINVQFLEMETPAELRMVNPLTSLLRDAAFGSRKATPVTVEKDAWTTSTKQCIVRPSSK